MHIYVLNKYIEINKHVCCIYPLKHWKSYVIMNRWKVSSGMCINSETRLHSIKHTFNLANWTWCTQFQIFCISCWKCFIVRTLVANNKEIETVT